jgi:hypothetical protein
MNIKNIYKLKINGVIFLALFYVMLHIKQIS